VLLYYSDSANTYNNWLQEILAGKYFENNINDYTEKVYYMVKQCFNKEKLSFPNITVLNLYFIDFLLWKLYKQKDVIEGLKSLKEKINNVKKLFSNFRFRSISSREHLLSQDHAKNLDHISEEIYNGLGNLCLISASQNSKGNNQDPKIKKKIFINDNLSLKRIIMFESFENDTWGEEQIKKHEEEIKALLEYYKIIETKI